MCVTIVSLCRRVERERSMTVDENPSIHPIGSSATLRAALEDVKTVASADCAVLVQGETGTGKEGIAQAIHDLSPRRRHRFAVVNCAAIPVS
jgi:transcriptional regulator with GAF, ATPase, and Fis domain